MPEPLRKRLGLTDRNTILQRLRQLPALSRAHLRALFGLSPVEPSQRLSDDNGYLQDSPSSFASPDELAQRQRTTFDALAATNERTLLLASQQPHFYWFAALILGRRLAQDFPQAAARDPDTIFLNTYEQTLYWPLSESGERGEQVRTRTLIQSSTLTEVFARHLAGNPQTFDPTTSGLYASATAVWPAWTSHAWARPWKMPAWASIAASANSWTATGSAPRRCCGKTSGRRFASKRNCANGT